MDEKRKENLARIRAQISDHFTEGIVPFWTERGIDKQFGGFLTNFDAAGEEMPGDTDKYIVTQTRMIWAFSLFHQRFPADMRYEQAARQGVDFFIKNFWDGQHGGWFWKVKQDGTLIDPGKVVYGQSFAIYALAKYYLATGDTRGLEYASQTFDLLQRYCVDSARGGYYENLEPDWQISQPGFHAGDRKSLDIHMHLLECFTTLYEASGLEIHRRRLSEVIQVIIEHMIHQDFGCGLNQFNLDFQPIPPIAIRRTWNAEREGELAEGVSDTTSYGHNLELAWLILQASDLMNLPRETYQIVIRRLVTHALEFGIDWDNGGIFRDGPYDNPALVRDKEWWQHAESLVGLLDGYILFGEARCLDAFERVWDFSQRYFINHRLGEWRTLLAEDGSPIDAKLGNPWKVCYHSGRALDECLRRLGIILEGVSKIQ
ncbi:MAG: AGE family epimerase/isomerase [Anaerolineales bacterium]